MQIRLLFALVRHASCSSQSAKHCLTVQQTARVGNIIIVLLFAMLPINNQLSQIRHELSRFLVLSLCLPFCLLVAGGTFARRYLSRSVFLARSRSNNYGSVTCASDCSTSLRLLFVGGGATPLRRRLAVSCHRTAFSVGFPIRPYRVALAAAPVFNLRIPSRASQYRQCATSFGCTSNLWGTSGLAEPDLSSLYGAFRILHPVEERQLVTS